MSFSEVCSWKYNKTRAHVYSSVGVPAETRAHRRSAKSRLLLRPMSPASWPECSERHALAERYGAVRQEADSSAFAKA